MANFPSKWFDFVNKKEIKRLRKDINNTLSFKIQIAVSILAAIASIFISNWIEHLETWIQVLIFIGLCFMVLLPFLVPLLIKLIQKHRRANILLNGKDAVNIFDEEIVYNVLVASEFSTLTLSLTGNLQNELKKFYDIEIKYYVTESVKKLNLFNSKIPSLFGDGRYKISSERAKNLIELIEALVSQHSIVFEKSVSNQYSIIKDYINKLP